jgi:aminoglycoside phosphotransferase (APT) family kinase protein
VSLDAEELTDAVAGILSLRYAQSVRIDRLERLSGGASRETFAFDAVLGEGGTRALVLQRERPGGMRSTTGMSVEASVVRTAATGGVPVPAVVAAQGDSVGGDVDLGGPWMITERIPGETLARRILRDDDYEVARSRLVAQSAQALAAIHRIGPAEAPGLIAGDPVEQQRVALDQLGQPHPALELGLRWLDRNRPPVRRHTVVHGDYRNGNLVVGTDGLRAVLDWELAHVGDPMEDLGWFCVRAWRFGSDLPVGGFGTREELAEAYEAAGGGPVDRAALHWWEVFGTLRWGVICIVQATVHLSGLSRSVELAAIGRRVCETEHDLMELLP